MDEVDDEEDYEPKIWFGPKWLGRTVKFENPNRAWKIVEKIYEKASRCDQDEIKRMDACPEVCSVFVCEDTRDSTTAIMKIHMQYGWMFTSS